MLSARWDGVRTHLTAKTSSWRRKFSPFTCSRFCLLPNHRSGFDGTARLWDTVTGECLKVFADHKRSVYALSFCPDGNWLATGSGDGWVHVYDVQVSSVFKTFTPSFLLMRVFFRKRRKCGLGLLNMTNRVCLKSTGKRLAM